MNNIYYFQERSNIVKTRVYILPASETLTKYDYQINSIYVKI